MSKKIVLVGGPGNSGSGAIHDLIKSSDKFISPFDGQEFRMVNDPYGLDSLFKSFYESGNFYNFSAALKDFYDYNVFLSEIKIRNNRNKNFLIKNKKKYTFLIETFIKKITEVEYYGYPQFSKFRISYLKNLDFKFKNLIYSNNQKRPMKMIIPKKKKIFLKESQLLLKGIFEINLNEKNRFKNIILNQGLNIFNPLSSVKFYGKAKCIIVLRDPKSIFYSMKSRKSFGYPGYNLDLFIDWYKKYFEKFKKIKSKNILYIQFEKFFLNSKSEIKKLSNFLGEEIAYKNFDFIKTEKNLFKAKNFLKVSEMNKIDKKLKKYIFW